jgi:hypothetical protein
MNTAQAIAAGGPCCPSQDTLMRLKAAAELAAINYYDSLIPGGAFNTVAPETGDFEILAEGTLVRLNLGFPGGHKIAVTNLTVSDPTVGSVVFGRKYALAITSAAVRTITWGAAFTGDPTYLVAATSGGGATDWFFFRGFTGDTLQLTGTALNVI